MQFNLHENFAYLYVQLVISLKQKADNVKVSDYSFEQSWSITNSGAETWPGSCRLIHAGEHFGGSPAYLPALPPGHSVTVTMHLKAPNTPGTHRSFFHVVTDKGDQIGGKYENDLLLMAHNLSNLILDVAEIP